MKLAGSRSARFRLLAVGAPVLLFAAACGGGSNDKTADDNGGGNSGGDSSATISVKDTSLGKTLVASNGKTVYFTEDETAKDLKCVSDACHEFWEPVTVADGQTPQVSGVSDIATIKRPDNSMQVTFQNHPLYTFSLDSKAGDVHGERAVDDFDGTHFTWHAALPGDAAAPAASTAPSSTDQLPGDGNDYPTY